MNAVPIIVFLVLFALILALGWVRLAPLPQRRLVAHEGPDVIGLHVLDGGAKLVKPLAELPDEPLDHLAWIISESLRSELLPSTDSEITAVTRSRRIGFPDITRIWVEDDNLHMHAHLVFGRKDFGVNAARVKEWLFALEHVLDEDEDDEAVETAAQ